MNQRRKNFLPALLLTLFSWLGWGYLVFFQSPNSDFLLVIFYLLLFLAVFLTTALIFSHTRRGLLLGLLVILILLFRYYQIGNLLNLGLLTLIFITLGFYWTR